MDTKLKIEKLLDDIRYHSPQRFEILQSIRDLIKSQSADLTEEVKYGGLIFSFGGDLKCGLFAYQNHLSLEFSNGAEFSDPHKLLEGKGKFRRHLKLREFSDIETKNVAHFVSLAVC